MWSFSKPTREDIQSKAYLVYHEFGVKARIARDERLREKFPDADRTTIKIWLDQFKAIDREIEHFTGSTLRFDRKLLMHHLAERFPFMNKKALEKAAYMGWFWTIM